MPDERPTRFKSRFSLTSLLPARHPPLNPYPPALPPTQAVKSRQPTIVSLAETEVSPIDSEYPLSAYSPPILPPAAPFTSSSYGSSSKSPYGSSHSSSARSGMSKRSHTHRPPPLDLTRTKQIYPGVPGVVPTAGTAAPEAMKEDIPLPPRKESKKAKKTIVVDDPFEIAEVEPGHKYTSWRGGRVSIKAGQVIPDGVMPKGTPTIRGVDPNMLTLNSPDMYDSVLHDVVLTPNYLRRSPNVPPTPSPASSACEDWPNRKSTRRKTLLSAIKRGSRMMQRDNSHECSMRDLRHKEAQEMARFRSANKSVRIREEEPTAYSTHSPMLHPGPFAYSRKSPASREWSVGVTYAERESKSKGDDGKAWKRHKEVKAQKKKQKVWKWIILLVVVLLAALTIGLCATFLTKSSDRKADFTIAGTNGTETTPTSITEASAYPTPSTAPSRTLTTCLELFATSAPTSPLSYPCSDCVPLLTSTTNDYSYPLSNGNSTGVGAALQFCALNDVFRGTSSNGLHEDGWMLDGSPCSWEGITCDDRGRVTELQLRYPDVPDKLPETLSNLVGLRSLRLMGNSTVPSGNFPVSMLNLANLSTIDIEYTALSGSISSVDFGAAQALSSLVLVNNPQLGNALPALNRNSQLKTLAVTGQGLVNVSELALPTALTYLDLSYNALSGQVPSLSTLTALQTLYFTNNNYTSSPASLPSTLSSLSLTGNANLQGFMPQAVCSSSALTSCDLRSTGLLGPNMVPGAMSGIFLPTAATAGTAGATSTTRAGGSVTTGKVCGSCRFA